jgi:hypothetical protein
VTTDTLTDLIEAAARELDERLAEQRRVDALRDAARCQTAESAEAVRQRFEIAQAIDDAPIAAVKVLQ